MPEKRTARPLLRVLETLEGLGTEEYRKRIIDELLPMTLSALKDAAEGKGTHVCDRCGAGKPQPWAIKLIMEASRIIGVPAELAKAMQATLGVSMETARTAIRVHEDAQAVDDHALALKAVQFLRDYRRDHAGQFELLVQQLIA